MKKSALFLAILMCFSLIISSCTGNNNGDVSDISNNSEASDTSGAESEPEAISPEYETCVSTGKSYTVNTTPDEENYPDSHGIELTDGIFASYETNYGDAKLSGWNNSPVSVVIDLGKVYDKLYKFEASYLSTNQAGIAPPSSVTVFYSLDNEDYVNAGCAVKPKFEEGVMQKAELASQTYIKARYIKFTILKASAWLFLDELSVYADIDDGKKNFVQNMFEAYESATKTDEQIISELNSVSNELVDRTKTKISVSKYKTYTLSREPLSTFNDNEKLLTDNNMLGASFESDAWVGFDSSEPLDIIIDLESVYDDLSDFEISFFNNITSNVSSPNYIDYFVSDDNENFIYIGRIYGPTDRDNSTFNYKLSLTYGVQGRYIKFSLPANEFDKCFIEEAAAYRYGTIEEAEETIYPAIDLPEITNEEFWNSSEPDYYSNINLIANKIPQITAPVVLPLSEGEYNSPVTNEALTDGVLSSGLDIHNGKFFKFHSGAHREVIFDLEKTSTVTELTASFLRYESWGVTNPPSINYYLSDDGTNWYLVGNSKFEEGDSNEIIKVSLTLDQPCKARFVRFSFKVGTWTGCDELEVFGTKKVDSSAKSLSSLGIEPIGFMTGDYLKPDDAVLGGVNDILLSYHCSYAKELKNPTVGYTSVEQYMPYVAYLDSKGNILDVMFDGYLYLPTSAAFPSGGLAHKDSIKSDWEYVLNNMFKEDYNIDALNKAAQIVKDELNLDDDYKYKVYLSLLYPTIDINFGDIDGDGVSDTLSDTSARIAAIQWYINEFYKRFNEGNYENLTFEGFYWHHETLSGSDEEIELLNGVADIVHSHKSQLFWIPYYLSSGYISYPDYGIDFACMQPNYAFKESAELARIKNTAMVTKMYEMCVELENDGQALTNPIFFKRWMEYLKGGVYYGYIDALHMYYQGGMPGTFYKAAMSDDPKLRLIYDYTYDFIKGTLDIYPEKLPDVEFETDKNSPLTDTLNIGNTPEYAEYRISVSPQHGTVTINTDGSFTYYPNKDFCGTDTFTYEYSELLDYSAPSTVTINVGN